MLLELGRHSFDITTHAIAMARTGAEIVDLGTDVGAATADGDVPFAARACSVAAADELLAAGVSLVGVGAATDPMLLPAVAEAGASVWLRGRKDIDDVVSFLHERARWAEAAGIAAPRIILESPIGAVQQVAALGYPVLVDIAPDAQARGNEVVAMMSGARIVRTRQVNSTRRTIFTIGELIARRGVAAPCAVLPIGAR